jgi:DNA-binding winged helix-turn-helix (wHTH) protein
MTPNLPSSSEFYSFGPFRFDPTSGELFKGSEKITRLQPKISETLRILLVNRGQVVEKSRLMQSVWPDVNVEESNLSRNISELRDVIGKEWIETIPRRGFRFRAEGEPVQPLAEAAERGDAQDARLTAEKRWPRWLVAALASLGAVAIVAIGTARRVDSEAGQAPSPAARTFYVYRDAAAPENHFRPTGYMGDCGDIEIQEADEEQPYAGRTSIRICYLAQGKAPHACPYQPPCRWAGVYWQHPPNNFGTEARFKDSGYNLSGFRRLRFAARADRPVRIEFTVGGIDERYGDSLREGRRLNVKVGPDWQEFEVDLAGADLKHIIGGFAWSTNRTNAPEGVTFWLDEIRFERD